MAVTELLKPTIQETVSEVVAKGIQALKQDLVKQTQWLTEVEDCVDTLYFKTEK